jgi:hypothetical protein
MKLTSELCKIARIAINAPKRLPPWRMNEEWTKRHLIIPLLKALGWDNPYEILSEDPPDNKDTSVNFLLKAEQPNTSSVFIKAKPFLTPPPQYRGDEQIKRGIEQARALGSNFFIWTNGDTWQLFAIELPNAPIYEIHISQEAREGTEIKTTAVKFVILNKEKVLNNAKDITEQIKSYWREVALSQSLLAVPEEGSEETAEVMRKNLPEELAISLKEVREFLTKLQSRLSSLYRKPRKHDRRKSTCKEERGMSIKSY